MKVAVIGAGAFGTALASVAAEGGETRLLARQSTEAAEEITTEAINWADAVIVAVSAQATRSVLRTWSPHLKPGAPLILAAKGLEMGSQARQSEIARAETPDHPVAVLTGPSFASEILLGLPTAVTLAMTDEDMGGALQSRISSRSFRLYLSPDIIGAELGGALKNVIAIACGAAIGAGLGESARAALMTRGFAEIIRGATAAGAQPKTLMGLSGFGDLALTCASPLSRNFSLGIALGKGGSLEALRQKGKTYEGASSASAAVQLFRQFGVEAPIHETVEALVAGAMDVPTAIEALLSRPLTRET